MPAYPTTDFLMLQLRLKDFWQRRSLGQHFLTDEGILERIAEAAGAARQTLAVEIGPGPGTLTAQLLRRAGAVAAVEFDARLEILHADVFGTFPEARFVYADALRTDLAALAREEMARRGLNDAVLTGNLPFQITSPLMFGLCGPGQPWRRLAFMVQKEVADRICSPPGRKDYGILTVKLAYWWRVIERFEVGAEKFFPKPRVDASVLVFEPLPEAENPPAAIWPGLSAFVDAAFSQRRKMLVNGLVSRWPAVNERKQAQEALEALGLSPQVRAEMLTADQFKALHALLIPKNEG
jgi:16S rRNA (adenine1518-N6/adenine1519-N6)-dimethyltransferase